MSFATERSFLAKYFQDNWNESTQGKIAWDNIPFNMPKDLFIVFQIVNLSGGQRSLGGEKKLERHYSEVQVDVYVPQNLGTHVARTTSDYIASLFRRKAFHTSDNDLLQFQTPIIRSLAPNETRAANIEDIKYRLMVRCPFYRDAYI